MSLLKVEFRRLLARRLARGLALSVLAAVLVTLAVTAYQSERPSAAGRARAERLAADQRARRPELARGIAACESAKGTASGPPAGFDCKAAMRSPQAADYLPSEFDFRSKAPARVSGFGVVLALFGFLLGATYAGAEWTAGTMASLLLWEPRRIRVVGSKAAALATTVAGVGVVVMVLVIVGHLAVAAARGSTAGTTAGVLTSMVLTALRGTALGAATALAGFAIAGTLRGTGAALGLGFAYFVGGEIALRSFWHGADAWLLTSNVGAWLTRNFTITRLDCPSGGGECTTSVIHLGHVRGGAYLLVVVGALLLALAVSFSRRDVT